MKVLTIFFYCLAFARPKALRGNGNEVGAENNFPRSRSRALNIRFNQRWKERIRDIVVVPYIVQPLHFIQDDIDLIDTAVQELGNATKVVTFTKWKGEAAYIRVVNNGACYSEVGRSPNGREQLLSLSKDCLVNGLEKGIIQHEFLHALGLDHEHNRPDRDQYITVNWSNIQDKRNRNFEAGNVLDYPVYGTPYQYGSLMHYGRNDFAKNNNISTIDPTREANAEIAPLGQRNAPTDLDLIKVRLLYQCISGPRSFQEYQANPCTPDCKCWEGARCNGTDDACQGESICNIDNVCSGSLGMIKEEGCMNVGWNFVDCTDFDNPDNWPEIGKLCDVPTATSYLGDRDFLPSLRCCACGGGYFLTFKFYAYTKEAYTRYGIPEYSAMSVLEGNTTNGNPIVDKNNHMRASTLWEHDNNGYMRSALDTSKCMVSAGGNASEGVGLMIHDCFPNDDRFVFVYHLTQDRMVSGFSPKTNESLCITLSTNEIATVRYDGEDIVARSLEWRTCSDDRDDQNWWKEELDFWSQALLLSQVDLPVKSLLEEAQKNCRDSPRLWEDARGFNCEWYGVDPQQRCINYGSKYRKFGKTAYQACCACGGGTLLTTLDREIAENPIPAGSCLDLPYWLDSVGDACLWYEQGEKRCEIYGNQFFNELGVTPNEACCVCGGGGSAEQSSPEEDEVPVCSDSPSHWADIDNYGCDWYAESNNCDLYGDDAQYAVNSKTAKTACCACGGGNRDSCSDSPVGWLDSTGQSCDWYAQQSDKLCPAAENWIGEDGISAEDACCVCGGGSSSVRSQAGTDEISTKFVTLDEP